MLNEYQEVEELLTMIQSEKIRSDFTYMQWLARACELKFYKFDEIKNKILLNCRSF